MAQTVRRVLSVAGSDPGGGAGIQADLKTFAVLNCYGMAALTALTAQNTLGVHGIHPVPPDFVRAQIDAVAGDIGVDAVKTGMLADAPIVRAVAAAARRHAWRRLVVDPVMVAKGGQTLLDPAARSAVIDDLLPLALIVTPNAPEAEALASRRIGCARDAYAVAQAIAAHGPRWVVIKGGHLGGPRSSDLIYDGQGCYLVHAPRFETANTHGTGCTYAAAIAACLAWGLAPLPAIATAKAFVSKAIELARDQRLGGGQGPVDHLGAAGVDWRPGEATWEACDPARL